MAEQLRVFVSHSHKDNKFCHKIVQVLRDAGVDVWYDEHNLNWGELHDEIQRELGRRAIFVLILSKAAFASKWVKRETVWAYKLHDRDPTRVIIPVTARQIDPADFDPTTGWLFLDDFKRIEAPGCKPYPVKEAATRLVRGLGLTPAGEAPTPIGPQPAEDVDDLLTRGRALAAQDKYAEALPLFERALALNDKSVVAWVNVAYTLAKLRRFREALAAIERMLDLDPDNAYIWAVKGVTLSDLKRDTEALVAIDRALTLDANMRDAWVTKGLVLGDLGRNEEALVAYDRALTIDSNSASAWASKGIVLRELGRIAEAEAAEKRAKELGWTG